MMKRRVIYQSVAAIGLLLAATHTPAQARIVITPHIETSFGYDSNFFRTENNQDSVTTWTISPGIQVIYKTAKTKASLDATAHQNQYYGFDTRGSYDYTGGVLSADVTSQLTPRLAVGLGDSLRVTRDPEYVDEFSQQVGRSKYLTNALTPNIYYDFGNKFGIGARYQNRLINFYDGPGEDYSENRGAFDFFYKFNRSTAAYLEYQIWKGVYDEQSSDYLSNNVTLNVSKQVNYFTFTAGAGYRHRSFSDSGLKNIDGVTWKIVADGRDRNDEDSRKPRSFVKAALIHDINDYGSGNTYYAATRLELRGGYLIAQRLGISGLALYQYEDYEMYSRTDNLYVLSARVDYEIIDKLTVGIEGGYRNRDSDLARASYDDTFAMVRLEYAYNFGRE